MLRNADQPDERRFKRRFPLNCQLRYMLLQRGKSLTMGTGITSDVSSGGIGFTADRPLPVGATVRIVMSWPATLPDGCPLQLVAQGRAVRSHGSWVACRIGKFQFHTMARTAC